MSGTKMEIEIFGKKKMKTESEIGVNIRLLADSSLGYLKLD